MGIVHHFHQGLPGPVQYGIGASLPSEQYICTVLYGPVNSREQVLKRAHLSVEASKQANEAQRPEKPRAMSNVTNFVLASTGP